MFTDPKRKKIRHRTVNLKTKFDVDNMFCINVVFDINH